MRLVISLFLATMMILGLGVTSAHAQDESPDPVVVGVGGINGFDTSQTVEENSDSPFETGPNAVQILVGDDYDVESVNPVDGTFRTINGSRYQLYDGKPYLLDGEGNPVIAPPSGAVANNASKVGVDADGNTTLNVDSNGNENLQRNFSAGAAVAEAFLEGSLNLANAMNQRTASAAMTLTGFMVGIWIFFHLVKLFMPFGMMEKGSDIFNSIVTRLALTLLVVVGLQATDVYQRVLYGAIDAVVGLSGTILEQASGINQAVTEDIIASTADIDRDPDAESLYAGGNPTDTIIH